MPKILIIDDDPDQILLYSTKFELEGFEVISASDGEKGIRLAEEENPDAIILDVVMEGIDGLEVLKRLKKSEAAKSIPVLLFTNLAKKDVADKGLKIGAVGVLIKTDFLPRELVKKINEILAKS